MPVWWSRVMSLELPVSTKIWFLVKLQNDFSYMNAGLEGRGHK